MCPLRKGIDLYSNSESVEEKIFGTGGEDTDTHQWWSRGQEVSFQGVLSDVYDKFKEVEKCEAG